MITLQLPIPRSCSAYDREEFWFRDLWENRFDESYHGGGRWRGDFRMRSDSFNKLVHKLTPLLQKQDTVFGPAIPVEKRVAIGIWRLATGNSYRIVAKTFAVGKSTAVAITHEFCRALIQIGDQFISFPTSAVEVGDGIENFKQDVNCKIPQVIGALDGTLIEILAPSEGHKADYFARNKRYCVNTQAIVGANLLFLHVATGYPGSIHDARMWRSSEIFQKVENREIFQYPEEIVENIRIKPLILADGAYPLSSYLMKPYPLTNALTPAQIKFNKKLSGARVTVERAFGILKARWRMLLKRLDSQITNVSDTIIACCVLHDFCQLQNDEYIDDDEVLQELICKEREANRARRQTNTFVEEAHIIREVLKQYVDEHF